MPDIRTNARGTCFVCAPNCSSLTNLKVPSRYQVFALTNCYSWASVRKTTCHLLPGKTSAHEKTLWQAFFVEFKLQVSWVFGAAALPQAIGSMGNITWVRKWSHWFSSSVVSWYLDGTFTLVRQPYAQLFSVNAFVQFGANMKQEPLAFVMMSGKRKKGYKKVKISSQPNVSVNLPYDTDLEVILKCVELLTS